jgi:hypothetical protein
MDDSGGFVGIGSGYRLTHLFDYFTPIFALQTQIPTFRPAQTHILPTLLLSRKLGRVNHLAERGLIYMTFTLNDYSKTRPYLYHLAFRHNLQRIRTTRRLESAASLLIEAARQSDLRNRRRTTLPITIENSRVLLRDQAPLHEGNIGFTGGWTFEDLLEDLNRRVFFWPGSGGGPNDYGRRHYEHYAAENPAMIRVAFDSLRDHNPDLIPLFTKYNTGSPRYSGGRPSPRGPDTFLPAEQCAFPPSKVVEVTFVESVILPDDAELSNHPSGPWTPLFIT